MHGPASGSLRCWSSPAPSASRPRDAGDQLLLGRGSPGDRPQALRQPGHRGRDAAWPGRAQRQGRRCARCRRPGERAHRAGERARSGKTQPADMAGGTFTITNVGVFGVDAGTPIINPGESAILALGAVRQQPWVVRGRIKPRWITTLALSFDHRLVDGSRARSSSPTSPPSSRTPATPCSSDRSDTRWCIRVPRCDACRSLGSGAADARSCCSRWWLFRRAPRGGSRPHLPG